jgi:4-guanidinobutyraldehyde dehydrogenase / NAD-dependent aldehyde dehydrogenase
MTSEINWSQKVEGLRPNGKAFIDGNYRDSDNGAVISRQSPVDGRALPLVTYCSEVDVNDAVAVARQAFEDGRWLKQSPSERKKILIRFADLISAHAEGLAILDSISMGKPIYKWLHADIPLAVHCIKWFAEYIDKIYDQCVPAQPNVLGTMTRGTSGSCWSNYSMELSDGEYRLENRARPFCWELFGFKTGRTIFLECDLLGAIGD